MSTLLSATGTEVHASIKKVKWTKVGSSWAILECASKTDGLFCAVGDLAHLRVGEEAVLSGDWVKDPKFGLQLKVKTAVAAPPSTTTAIAKYLDGLVQGIGPGIATRIVTWGGVETLAKIDADDPGLREVKGVTPEMADQIVLTVRAEREVRAVIEFLGKHHIREHIARKAFMVYGTGAVTVAQQDPYRMADEVSGIGFAVADQIARALNMDPEDPKRIRAGLAHVLKESSEVEGHCYLPIEDIVRKTSKLLGVGATSIERVLFSLDPGRGIRVHRDAGRVASARLEDVEADIAEIVFSRVSATPYNPTANAAILESVMRNSAVELNDLQRRAVEMSMTMPLVIVTGGPGTGKTTTLKAIVSAAKAQGHGVTLASPTGKAAVRMSEASGEEAKTLHRILQCRDGWIHDYDGPFLEGVVIVDEFSMCDVELAGHLFASVKSHATVVIIGDVDQLPSVGPGSVLRDLIAAGVPTVRLEHVYRQGASSLIKVNAHHINHVRPLEIDNAGGDFIWYPCESSEQAAEKVVDVVATGLVGLGYDPSTQVQILAPMRRGDCGVDALNKAVRLAVNPAADPGAALSVNDRVMQIRNDYDLGVFNGETGRVLSASPREVIVSYDGRHAVYKPTDIDGLRLAYASTIHKSQGSEYPVVVLVLMDQHTIMLQRTLFYTALTRAKTLCVLIASPKAIGRAIKNAERAKRYTRLETLLREAMNGEQSTETQVGEIEAAA